MPSSVTLPVHRLHTLFCQSVSFLCFVDRFADFGRLHRQSQTPISCIALQARGIDAKVACRNNKSRINNARAAGKKYKNWKHIGAEERDSRTQVAVGHGKSTTVADKRPHHAHRACNSPASSFIAPHFRARCSIRVLFFHLLEPHHHAYFECAYLL